ncbi:MAG: bifunctional adenosylcobinamide kinase/adenosylcobinamide-phosphate guanylyltransferase [Coriobacteriia bacterium]|nr:bifunctional adenosylcobinamide kinase/adenosylcobinamide-phosphate guanylyltransferase [Coriobacteriia bacterium]
MFITGGCKNGKSGRAEQLALAIQGYVNSRSDQSFPLYYVATMVSSNDEDERRITQHQLNRAGLGFTTIEIVTEIDALTNELDKDGVVLLDSLTALLLNEMIGATDQFDIDAVDRTLSQVASLIDYFNNMVLVSDYIYSDAALYDDLTTQYRLGLASIDRMVAARADIVVEACFGNYVTHKGADALEELLPQFESALKSVDVAQVLST